MRVGTVRAGANTFAVAEAGSAGSGLLLLHGFTGAKEDFADWLDPLAERGWHVVAPDHRGHGDSVRPADEGDYSLVTMSEDALGVADAMGWERFAVLGHSMGGMVAQVLALREPHRVTRLVLMDTGHGPVEGVDRELAGLAIAVARAEGMDALADAIATIDAPLSSAADARVRAERPGYIEFGERKLRASSPAMYAAMAAEMFEQDDRLDALRSLAMPVLIIVGEQDTPFLPPAHRMAEAIPGARLEIIDDAGHSPQFEAPGRWWSALTSFLGDGERYEAEAPGRLGARDG